MRALRTAGLAIVALTASVGAQGPARVRSAVFFEQYRFDDGFLLREMSELTVPLSVDLPLGERASVVISTGYVSVNLTSADPVQLPDQQMSGLTDTEVRLTFNVRPGRLLAFLTGTLPTGQRTVADDELAVLVALTNDAIGFVAPSLGSGGSVGGGFSTAIPLGRFAIGAAATGTQAFAYEPIAGDRQALKPGSEMRLRLGLEGPLGPRTYLRTAWALAVRQKDQFAGESVHGLGQRNIGYLTVEQGIGSSLLSVYAFDVLRGAPQIESSAIGAAVLPRGNLLAAGMQFTSALGGRTSITPRVEYRVSTSEHDADASRLIREASSVRIGADLRHRLGGGRTLVIQGDRMSGEALQGGTYYGVTGFRGAVHLEVAR